MNKLSKEDKKILKNALKKRLPVTVYCNNETGIFQWSIFLNERPEFWLNSFPNKEDAIKWCKIKRLPITEIMEGE